MRKILALLTVIFIFLAGCSSKINLTYVKDLPSDITKYPDDFGNVLNTVNKNYTHLKNKNLDTTMLRIKYMEFVKEAKTNLEYADILLRYFAELKNGHSGAIFKRYYKECAIVFIEDRVFLSRVGDESFLKNGISEKDEITKINNQPVLTYIQEQTKYTSASTNLYRTYMAASSLFTSHYEEDRTYTIITSSGEKNVTLHFDNEPTTKANVVQRKIESKLLNDSVAYIAIQTMEGDIVPDFIQAFEKLSNKPYLVVDVRKNQGGNSGNSEAMTEYLIKENLIACVSKRTLKPKGNYYKGKLFVLTSPYTFSAAESFVLDLAESGNSTLVGMPTGGDTGNQPKIYNSELGYCYRFPSRKEPQVSEKGFPMEGKSIEPNFLVHRTVSDYLKGEDTVLNYVLSLIKK